MIELKKRWLGPCNNLPMTPSSDYFIRVLPAKVVVSILREVSASMMRPFRSYCLGALTVFLFLLSFFAIPKDAPAEGDEMKHVLVLNSYHEGYRWTDDIVEGINSVFGPRFQRIQVDFEYMDAKRRISPAYLERLHQFYRYKFGDNDYDLVLCSDETAFGFLQEYHREIFPETPVVFCGLEHFDEDMLEGKDFFTGVVEIFDLRATLATMLRLHPDRHRIYVVNDHTAMGRSIGRELDKVIPDFPDLEFVPLEGLEMEELQARLSHLPQDSLVLFLAFSRDVSGKYFTCEEGISRISSSSNVPVYGPWDFHLGHGIVGGLLAGGFDQGRRAALLAMRILEGEALSLIPVVRKYSDRYAFDRVQLERFGIDRSRLPENSLIINQVIPDRKRLLVLHSYDPHMLWVHGIDEGIQSILGDRKDIDIFHDYMDLKRHPRPEFVQRLFSILREKYEGKKFDAILVSDDAAYNFLLAHRDRLFPQTPVVFCGVNDFDPARIEGQALLTGLASEIDVKDTLDLALKLHPQAKRIVVINDRTDLGKTARKKVESVMDHYRGRVGFAFFEEMDMPDLLDEVAGLAEDSIILLLVFNQDGSKRVFTYEESIRLIAERAKVPIYGIWDFYLGHGLLGGRVTRGVDQGQTTARMVERILDGESVSDIPVIRQSPNHYMFDYSQLERFGIGLEDLPPGSIIINRPVSFYEQYRLLVWATVLVVVTLASAVIVLAVNVRRRKKVEAELRYYATTDEMTGVLNRRTGLLFLEQQLALADRQEKKLCVCFADLNNLKEVNDNCGHDKGDAVILNLCRLLKAHIRSSDILCRLGGDEFLVILPGCSLAEAERIWRRIEERIRRHNAEAKGFSDRVSVSHGFAEYDPSHPVTLDDLIRVADQAMYREKEKSKSRERCQ